jgi:hypothetical protein
MIPPCDWWEMIGMKGNAMTNIKVARLLFVPAALFGSVLGQSAAHAASLQWSHDGALSFDLGDRPVATWSGGALLALDAYDGPAPLLHVFDQSGQQIATRSTGVPGAVRVHVNSAGRGLDGAIAICGDAFDAQGRVTPFLSIVSLDGNSSTVVRTAPYEPFRVAVVPDGTVWTEGFELIDGKEGPGVDRQAGVLRHFDKSGRQIGSLVQRSTAGSALRLMNSFLAASADGRVGWQSGRDPGQPPAYYEIAKDGAVTEYPGVPLADRATRISGIALTDDGNTYLATYRSGGPGFRLFRLDRTGRGWAPVGVPDGIKAFHLYGAQSNGLVLFADSRFLIRFFDVTQ